MSGNLNLRPIGRCSECGGVVSVPAVYMSMNRPIPRCERCGAVVKEGNDLPIMKTTPRPKKED